MEDYYKVKRLNNSLLSTINPEQGGSPKKYLKEKEFDREEKFDKSLESGKIVHKYCENPAEFKVLSTDKPSDKLGIVADKAIEICKQLESPITDDILLLASRNIGWNDKWKDDAIIKNTQSLIPYINEVLATNDLIALTTAQKSMLDNCVSSLRSHKKINEFLFVKDEFANIEYFNELVIFFEIGEVECKAMIDRLIINHDTKTINLTDIKTTSKSVYQFRDSLDKYHYNRQLAFYKLAVKKHFKLDYQIDCHFAVVETIGNYNAVLYLLENNLLDEGLIEVADLMNRIKYHEEHGYDYSMEEYQGNGLLKLE